MLEKRLRKGLREFTSIDKERITRVRRMMCGGNDTNNLT